jgi:thiol-disulfide isomerase/thioredoxin
MTGLRGLCVVLLCLPVCGQVFSTGDPVLPKSSGEMLPLSPAEYRKFALWAAAHNDIKVIRQLPGKLSPNYRLGYNFQYDGGNHGWILDRDSDGYKLYLDRRGDGDLRDAQALRFHDESGVSRIDVPIKDGAGDWTARFELFEVSGDKTGSTRLRINLSADRSGTILLDGRKIPFRLSGASGRYNVAGTYAAFDRDGDGHYDSYRSTDRWVNLAGKTYEFYVDPHGAALTLKEAESREDRPSLKNGSLIPEVALSDLRGERHVLRHNEADFTLLEFWNTNCAPCREEMPKLKALRDRWPRSRFEIVGITSDESESVLEKYLAEFAITWAECREADDGPVHRLLRIDGIPAYFLLSKDGEIIDQWAGSGATISRIEAVVR